MLNVNSKLTVNEFFMQVIFSIYFQLHCWKLLPIVMKCSPWTRRTTVEITMSLSWLSGTASWFTGKIYIQKNNIRKMTISFLITKKFQNNV